MQALKAEGTAISSRAKERKRREWSDLIEASYIVVEKQEI